MRRRMRFNRIFASQFRKYYGFLMKFFVLKALRNLLQFDEVPWVSSYEWMLVEYSKLQPTRMKIKANRKANKTRDIFNICWSFTKALLRLMSASKLLNETCKQRNSNKPGFLFSLQMLFRSFVVYEELSANVGRTKLIFAGELSIVTSFVQNTESFRNISNVRNSSTLRIASN